MTLLFIFTSALFFVWVIRNILFWVFLWQLKEYRFDRIFIHLRETSQDRNLLFSPLALLKWIAIFSYGLVVFDDNLLLWYQVFVTCIFLFQGLLVLREFSSTIFKKPAFTPKALFIVFGVFLLVFALYIFPLFERFLWLIFIDKFATFSIAIFVLLLSIPTELYRDLQIEKAVKKIKQHKKLLVIGVTGSYGKSSTKEYIAQVLGLRFRVLKTQGTNNTPIGIAKTINSGLKEGTEIFVVEMGAYKRGEIGEMCQIVHPRIGVVTAVNDQHLSLFGSLENTLLAKYELIESLPKNGLSLFNGNNKNAYQLYRQTKKKKVLYMCLESKAAESMESRRKIFARNIKAFKTLLAFDVLLEGKIIQLKAPLIGSQNVENILPAVYLADYLGMSAKEIKKAVSLLIPLPKTMTLHKIPHGPTVIDDTFNANPSSVLAVLNYMKMYKGKKVLIFQPMIELGQNVNDGHYKVGREASRICDYLFLTNKNFNASVRRGVGDAGGPCIVKTGTTLELSRFIEQNCTEGDIVVCEGKEANFVLDKIL